MYPPPYERTVLFYKIANPALIRKAINEFHWIRALSNVSVEEKVCYLTETLLNIIHNFMPHERIVCDDQDPPWINKEIKILINEKNSAYKSYYRFNRNVLLFEKFKVLQSQLNVSIENSKQRYYSKLSSNLATPAASSKTFWSILKTFLNNKKISCIPLLTNFKENAKPFNTFFYKPMDSIEQQQSLPNNLAKLTNKPLDTVNFSTDDISKIINNLDPNKTHGHAIVSIRMIKLCENSICKPLSIIFNDCLKEGKFPSD